MQRRKGAEFSNCRSAGSAPLREISVDRKNGSRSQFVRISEWSIRSPAVEACMANRRRKKQNRGSAARGPARRAVSTVNLDREYRDVCQVAAQGRHQHADRLYHVLEEKATEPTLKALIANDLGALSALSGDIEAARRGFEKALGIDRNCEPARANLDLLEGRGNVSGQKSEVRGQRSGVSQRLTPHPQPLSPKRRGASMARLMAGNRIGSSMFVDPFC